jgi:ABC-type multidrug transport system fused ATPase/permease subunit
VKGRQTNATGPVYPEYSSYSWGYCTGNLFIMITSMMSFAACVLLLVCQLKSQGWNKLPTYKKTKTWIFILMSIFEFTVVLRYTFTLYYTWVYDPMLAIA